jgi:anti-sigma-K factor RskA
VKFRGKPDLHERLAAEYALGTLRGAARRRFEQWMREDASIALAAANWQERLAPLAAGVAPVAPPARVWRAVRDQVREQMGERQKRGAAGSPSPGFWDNVAFWRPAGLVASGLATALLAVSVLLSPRAPDPAPAPVVLRLPAQEIPNSYFAVLSDPKSQKPVLVAFATRRSDQLSIRTLDPSIQVAGRSLELWALPEGKAPKSLGVISETQKVSLKLAGAADESLADVPTLAVSLEPRGGSPTGAPTGPVLFTGPCIKYW